MLILVAGILFGALSEELGWRGYALDRFQRKWRPFTAGLILGFIWWAWQLSLSLLVTWLCNRNRRSILAAVLFHFMNNFVLGVVLSLKAQVLLFETLFILAICDLLFLRDRPGSARARSIAGT